MKKTRVLISIITFLVFLSSMSFANGLNLNGLGPRAVAMGGAFVGLADDYSAVFWNPAGLAHIKQKYIAFYGFDIIPSMDYELETPIPGVGADASSISKHYLGGLAGYFQPVSDNLVLGLAVYSPSGLGIEWDGADLAGISGGNTNIDWVSKFFVITISPTLSYKVNDMIQLGFALNINYGSFHMDRWAGSTPTEYLPIYVDFGQQSLELTGWGFGATLGLMVKPNDMVSLGLTVRTPSTIGFSGDLGIENLNGLEPYLPLLGLPAVSIATTSRVETDLTMPLWLAGGIAFKPMEEFILTFDLQWTNWSKIEEVALTVDDQTWGFILDEEDTKLAFRWKDKMQIRFGAEYWLSPKFALRAGYYYDPGPAPDETRNILLPITDFSSVAGGFGYNVNGVVIDFAVEYLMGKEQTVPFGKTLDPAFGGDPDFQDAMPGVYHVKSILAIEASIGYKW
ncbi:MAG: outer membrane protein transport protein [Candidatus Aminicenantes bacterium]|jgi:long-chain fatty acid transport protein